ncbi:MAG: DUF3368 domain-containing protein [Firmicutes bacterium]|nr:DUF3368 domain-containing protein [Bacillota bacterium]
MPTAVSNSSTPIHLSAIGRLDLLREFFEKVMIPPAVWNEVVEQGKGRPGAEDVRLACQEGWINLLAPNNRAMVSILRMQLDAGEAEAIALAAEHKADILLIDESEGREVARNLGLSVTGSIGILLRAYRSGKVSSLQQEMERLRSEAGFWISDALYQRIISLEETA